MSAIAVNGILATSARILVPWCGVWSAEVRFAEPPRLTGPVTLTVDGASFVGVVADEQSGSFADRGALQIVGGRGGWRRNLPAIHEHNDGTLTRGRVASKVALECGETVTVDPAADGVIGVDFVRPVGAAHRVLDNLFPSTPWWVDPVTGSTRVGEPLPLDVSLLVTVLEADPVSGRAEIVAEDLRNVMPGGFVVDPRFDAPFVIRDVEIQIGERSRIYATRGSARNGGTLGLFRQLVADADPSRAFALHHRYRVVSQGSDGRLDLQAASRRYGMPDLRFVSVLPGVAGSSSVHTPGAIVVVTFLEADPALPVVIGLAPQQDPGFRPLTTKIEAALKVEIPGETASNLLTAPGRFIRWGDQIPHPVTGIPMPLVPHATNPTMANTGTTVLP